MASAMPSEPATQAALAAEGRPLKASRLVSEDLIRQSLGVGNLKHIQAVVQDGLPAIAQDPVVARRALQQLPRQVRRAHHHRSRRPFPLSQRNIPDPVPSRILLAKVGQVQRLVGMLRLILTQCNQSLPPVNITVAQELVTTRRIDEDIEIGKVAGRVAQGVCRLKTKEQAEQPSPIPSFQKPLCRCRRVHQQKRVYRQHMSYTYVDSSEYRDREKDNRENAHEQQISPPRTLAHKNQHPP